MEERKGTKVGMRAQCNFLFLDWTCARVRVLGRALNYTGLAAARAGVELTKSSNWKTEVPFEDGKDGFNNCKRLPYERSDSVLHTSIDYVRVRAVDDFGIRERVILRDIDELNIIGTAILVRCRCT